MKNGKYLYNIIYTTIKQEILDGTYEYKSLLPSEREICLRFKVERTTVRKAMELLVNDNFVEKIAGVGTKVIYQNDNASITPFSQGKSKVIGVFMVDDVNNNKKIMQPYYAELFYYLEIEAKAKDCQIMYATINPSMNIPEILQSQNFLAIIFISNIDPQYIELAQRMNIPSIMINGHHDGLPSITYDNVDGTYKVIKYLYEMGHHNIALITGPTSYYTSNQKLTGCLKAFYQYNLSFKKENIAHGNWEYQSGYDCAIKIFSDRKNGDIPTALFVFNDMMALGAIKALKDLSLSIPKDISIIGFDNMEQLKYTEPELTTVDTRIFTVAKIAIESVVSKPYELFDSALQIHVPVELVIRGTVSKR